MGKLQRSACRARRAQDTAGHQERAARHQHPALRRRRRRDPGRSSPARSQALGGNMFYIDRLERGEARHLRAQARVPAASTTAPARGSARRRSTPRSTPSSTRSRPTASSRRSHEKWMKCRAAADSREASKASPSPRADAQHERRPAMHESDDANSAPLISMEGVEKWYGDVPGAQEHQPDGPQRREDRPVRAVRIGQIDADPLHQPPRDLPEGPHRRRRHRARRQRPRPSTRSAARSAWCSSSSTCSRI